MTLAIEDFAYATATDDLILAADMEALADATSTEDLIDCRMTSIFTFLLMQYLRGD